MASGEAWVKYVGPHDGVDVARPDGSTVTAVRGGDPIKTSAEHADALLAQTSNWQSARAPKEEPAK